VLANTLIFHIKIRLSTGAGRAKGGLLPRLSVIAKVKRVYCHAQAAIVKLMLDSENLRVGCA